MFHAVAVDYDGSLTTARRPAAHVLAALERVRDLGVKVVIVTGRIGRELRRDFPASSSSRSSSGSSCDPGVVQELWHHMTT